MFCTVKAKKSPKKQEDILSLSVMVTVFKRTTSISHCLELDP